MDLMAYLGFAYDRKIASSQLIAKRSMRTGDGSFKVKPLWHGVVSECNFNDENCHYEVYESKK